MKVTATYFSATFTTKRVVNKFTEELGWETNEYDITNTRTEGDVSIPQDELLVVGIPVYAGRVPVMAAERLRSFKGNGSPAVAIAVYGNRHYDDAVMELADILTGNGLKVVSAAAFVAQHSIFPKVGAGRPDKKDLEAIGNFAAKTKSILEQGIFLDSHSIPGKHPYKIPGNIPIWPGGTRKCNSCGICAKMCPAKAINPASPKDTEKEKCIKCGRCIAVCPQHARRFKGIKYLLASYKFNKACANRREAEMWFA